MTKISAALMSLNLKKQFNMFKAASIIFLLITCWACRQNDFRISSTGNYTFIRNTKFIGFENISLPKFEAIKKRYQLDTIFHGEKDEFKRILLLRNWINKTICIDNIGPFPGDESAESILDEALKGHGFHCAHFSLVQEAVMNAYGYVTRYVRVDDADPVNGEGHHAVNEIWLNRYGKWFMSDAKYNYHFEKNGVPLSALDIREEYLKNNGKDLNLMKGPERILTTSYPELKNRTKEGFAKIFTWISWSKHNDVYSDWPGSSSELIVFDDAYFRSHTWIRDGKPHWAYHTPYFDSVSNRSEIEWTPNVISAAVHLTENNARIQLTSDTPNFKTYQMKNLPDGNWYDVPSVVQIHLKNNNTVMLFRTVNMANVPGPEYKVTIGR